MSDVQAKRVLLLDGVVHILEAFTDFEKVALSSSVRDDGVQVGRLEDRGDGMFDDEGRSLPLLGFVMAVLSAVPADLVKHRYLPQLAAWVAGFPLQFDDATVEQKAEGHTLWLGVFKRQVQTFLQQRAGHLADLSVESGSARLARGSREGRSLCLLGLMLSEGFSDQYDRDQVRQFALLHKLP